MRRKVILCGPDLACRGPFLLVLLLPLVLAGCAALPGWNELSPRAMEAKTRLEPYGEAIQHAIQNSQFSENFAGIYARESGFVVLVTGNQGAIHALLVEQGIPTPVFEIRTVETPVDELQRVVDAVLDWMGTVPISGGATPDVENNSVGIMVDRQTLVEMIGFDPGDQAVPYELWPESLKVALEEFISQVKVELFAGFTLTRDDALEVPATPMAGK